MANWQNSSQFVQDIQLILKPAVVEALTEGDEAAVPQELQDWLGRLRLFYGLPFEYLVPDERLLPKESIRFFYVDRNWTDRLVDGALSVGKTSTKEFAHHHAVNTLLNDTLDGEERRIRPRLRPQFEDPGDASANDITGLLLRSQVVSGWPGTEVSAYAELDMVNPLRLLRMERLSPDVLLCLFDGIPRSVVIEEPREGLQFGVDMLPGENNAIHYTDAVPSGFELKMRHMHGEFAGYELGWKDTQDGPSQDGLEPVKIAVPVREANGQVLHIEALQQLVTSTLADIDDVSLGGDGDINSAELAVQMLQFPYQQVFQGDGRAHPGDDGPKLNLGAVYTASTIQIKTHIDALSDNELSDLFPLNIEVDDR